MLIYHQCGHNFVWNIQSLQDDGVGEGLIISPVNVDADRIDERIPSEILATSWLDPQFYLPHDTKNKLESYPFFPGNVLDDFTTGSYQDHASNVARECLEFQRNLGLRYLVIPSRHFEDLPEGYLEQLTSLFVEPFIEARLNLGLAQPALLTVVAKPLHLEFGSARDDLLSWATSFDNVDGVYLILDHDSQSKQIKAPEFLAGVLRFINALRLNDMEVHVGYCGIEGLLWSVADPTSVTVGSYENLRSFSTRRLETREEHAQQAPRPRVYSGRLFQWIPDVALPPLRELVEDWTDLFDESPYSDYLLARDRALNFQRSEIYKHYFYVFQEQVSELPPVSERTAHLRDQIDSAFRYYDMINSSNVFLDSDADRSHLSGWLNALAMFEAQPE